MKTESNIHCLDCTAHCKSIFKEIDQILNLAKIQRVTHFYKKGEVIFHQGTPISGVYCLSEGIVKLFSTDDDGGEIILRLAGHGELLGHGCVSAHKTHPHSAIAIEDVRCCFLETFFFQDLLRNHPPLMLKVFNKVQAELSEAQSRNAHLAKKNVRERLAYYFAFMAEQHGEIGHDGVKINTRLSREELASYIGTAHETAIRFISEFKSQGLIKEDQKFFYILKWQEIAKIAGKSIGAHISQ